MECHPDFEELRIGNDKVISLAGIEPYPGRRKVYHSNPLGAKNNDSTAEKQAIVKFYRIDPDTQYGVGGRLLN